MNTLLHAGADLDAIDLEIARLALLCDIPLLQPGVIEAVFHGNHSVCRSDNPIAWEKLRGLLVLHYHVVNASARDDGRVVAAEQVLHSATLVRQRLLRVALDPDDHRQIRQRVDLRVVHVVHRLRPVALDGHAVVRLQARHEFDRFRVQLAGLQRGQGHVALHLIGE